MKALLVIHAIAVGFFSQSEVTVTELMADMDTCQQVGRIVLQKHSYAKPTAECYPVAGFVSLHSPNDDWQNQRGESP